MRVLDKDRMFVNNGGRFSPNQTSISHFDRIFSPEMKPTSVTEDAIQKIRERIASGTWGPGTRLPREADLAAELGLSRSSLREAVRALSLIRVLEVRQGDGTYVSSLAADSLLDALSFIVEFHHDA